MPTPGTAPKKTPPSPARIAPRNTPRTVAGDGPGVGEQQVAVPQNTIDIPTQQNAIRAQARRTCGVSHMVEAQPAQPRVERAPGPNHSEAKSPKHAAKCGIRKPIAPGTRSPASPRWPVATPPARSRGTGRRDPEARPPRRLSPALRAALSVCCCCYCSELRTTRKPRRLSRKPGWPLLRSAARQCSAR